MGLRKMYILMILPFSLLFGCASTQPIPSSETTFQKIIEIPGISKDQIYDKSRIWIAQNFRSSKAVIEYENRETGVIVGNGLIPYATTGFDAFALSDWKVRFTMKEDIKDNKIRVTFENLFVTWPPSVNRTTGYQAGGERPLVRQDEIDRVKSVLLKTADDLAKAIQTLRAGDKW